MADDDEREHKVGYRSPPLHSRFRPGHSGNPAGRPRHAKNASTLIGAVLAERIAVRENGRLRKVSKLEASLKQLANKAAGGDTRAILAVIALGQGLEARDGASAPSVPLDEADRRVLDRLVARVSRAATRDDGGDDDEG